MKIREAPWEKKNLGVNSVEYLFEETDDMKCIDFSALSGNKSVFTVCRVPAGRMDITYKLQSEGFRFAEAVFEVKCMLKNWNLPGGYGKYIDLFNYSMADDEKTNRTLGYVRGGLFDNDRITLDPHFGPKLSAIRYYNWLSTELNKGTTKLYEVCMESTPIGFFALKEINDTEADSMLAGLYDKNKYGGFGFATLFFPMLQAKKEGKKKITTNVSSNNLISVKTHLSLGYSLTGLKYVLTRYQD